MTYREEKKKNERLRNEGSNGDSNWTKWERDRDRERESNSCYMQKKYNNSSFTLYLYIHIFTASENYTFIYKESVLPKETQNNSVCCLSNALIFCIHTHIPYPCILYINFVPIFFLYTVLFFPLS